MVVYPLQRNPFLYRVDDLSQMFIGNHNGVSILNNLIAERDDQFLIFRWPLASKFTWCLAPISRAEIVCYFIGTIR